MSKKTTIYQPPIAMTQEFWRDSQFSIARYYGGIVFNGVKYVICDKEGRDIYELSRIADKEGRTMAIEPGETADLVIADWLPIYRAVGRERFMGIVKETNNLAVAEVMAGIRKPAKSEQI